FVFGAHGQRRIGQIRQEIDLQTRQRDETEQNEGERDHADGNAPARSGLDDVHPWAPGFLFSASACGFTGVSPMTCTAVPSRTALRPTVMTRAPSSTPPRIST